MENYFCANSVEEQVDYLTDKIKDLKTNKSNATNLENGTGENSIKQKESCNVEGDDRQNYTYGRSNAAFGHKNKTYQIDSFAFGGGNKAGLTEEEFNTVYASNIKDGIIYDNDGATYDESYALSVALCEMNDVTGRGSLGAGTSNIVAGRNAIGLGFSNEAREYCSIAMNYDCVAAGPYSTAMNYNTVARGKGSFAANKGGEASGNYSAKFGRESKAIGSDSFAGGYQTEAQKWAGVAFGVGTKSSAQVQTVIGRYNKINESENQSEWELFQVGNGWGSADNQRSNAFSVLYDGRAKVKSAPIDDDDVVRKGDLRGGVSGGKLYKHTITVSGTKSNGAPYEAVWSIVDNHNKTYTFQDIMGKYYPYAGGMPVVVYSDDPATPHFLALLTALYQIVVGTTVESAFSTATNFKDTVTEL